MLSDKILFQPATPGEKTQSYRRLLRCRTERHRLFQVSIPVRIIVVFWTVGSDLFKLLLFSL